MRVFLPEPRETVVKVPAEQWRQGDVVADVEADVEAEVAVGVVVVEVAEDKYDVKVFGMTH